MMSKFNNIPILFFKDPNFNGKMVIECGFERSPSGVAELSKKKKIDVKKFTKNLRDISNVHFKKFYKKKIYFNLEKIKKRLRRDHHVEKNTNPNYFFFILNYIFGKNHPITGYPFKILKFKDKFRPSRGYEYLYWLLKATLRTLILKISYHFNSSYILPKKYVLYAMTYQPEATSFPEAGIFHDQFDLIMKISKLLNKDTKILVKEHPMQLNLLGAFNYKNPQTRDLKIYKNLSKVKNISLLSQRYDMDDATKKAEYTITINGSVAIQSVKNGTPALTFGHAWYVGCESIYKLNSISDLKKFFISRKVKIVNKNNAIHFLNCVNQKSIRLWFKKFHRNIYSYTGFTNLKNRQNIKKIIKRDFKHFYKTHV